MTAQRPQLARKPASGGASAALRATAWVAVAAAAAVAPMALRGDASGHDFAFHLSSWMDVAAQWRQGIVFPRWAEWANWGFGEPRFIFYPPLSWMLGAAIGSVLPWRMAASTFIWLALAGAGLAMHKLAREWMAEPQAAVAAVLYAVNPYNLVIVYYRSAFGELLAIALMPPLVWAALRLMRDGWWRAPALALVFAAIWLSDAPAAVIATYALVIVIAVGCTLQRSWRPLARGAAAMAGGFGLAAFYILPAAWEQRWVQIALATTQDAQPARNFLFTRSNEPDFIAFNWKVSACVAGIAVVTIAAGPLARRGARDRREIWWMLIALAVVSLFMMLPLSALLWRFLPELRFIQFPWRWAGVLAIAFALFTGAAMADFSRKRAAWVAGVALAAAIGCSAALMIQDAWWDADGAPDIMQAIQSGRGYEGADEYQPIGSDRSRLPGNSDDTERPPGVSANPAPLVALADPEKAQAGGSQAQFHVTQWTAEQKEFTVSDLAPSVVALRLLAYPAWKVRVDGKLARFDSQSETGQMLVALPAGEHQVSVQFSWTWDRELGGVISIFVLVAIGAAGFWGTKQGQP